MPVHPVDWLPTVFPIFDTLFKIKIPKNLEIKWTGQYLSPGGGIGG